MAHVWKIVVIVIAVLIIAVVVISLCVKYIPRSSSSSSSSSSNTSYTPNPLLSTPSPIPQPASTPQPLPLLLENTITVNADNQSYMYSMILPSSVLQPSPITLNANDLYILYTSGFANPVTIQTNDPNEPNSYYIEQTLSQIFATYSNDFIVGFAYNPTTQYLYYIISNKP